MRLSIYILLCFFCLFGHVFANKEIKNIEFYQNSKLFEKKNIDESYKEYSNKTILRWLNNFKYFEPLDYHEIAAHPKANELEPAEVEDLESFRNSSNYFLYRKKADQVIEEGALIKEFYFIFSGFDGESQGITDGRSKYSYIKEKKASSGLSRIMPITIEIRDILQYRLQLEKLALKCKKNPSDCIRRAKLIFHVDKTNKKNLEKDLREFDWFGFCPDNIVVIVQPKVDVYKIIQEKVFSDSTIKQLGGHGYAFSQIAQPELGEIYSFYSDGKVKPLTTNVISYFQEKGAKFLVSAAVNDLTQLTRDCFEPDCLALVLYMMDQGNDVVLEMVKNPERKAGAYWVKYEQKSPFVVHSRELLHYKAGIQRPLERIINEGAFYSKFVHYSKLEALEKVLTRFMFPLSLELNDMDDTYCLKSFADDICCMPGIRAAAFHKKDKITHVFKFDEDLPEALSFMLRQDMDPEFKALVKKVYLKRVSKHIKEPLQFYTHWTKTLWGGSNIAALKNIPAMYEEKIGEVWEISAQVKNPSYLIIDGELQPLTLEDLMNDDEIARQIVGQRVFNISKHWFPILYKFLDASEILSVQVHPSTEVAKNLGECEPGKSETWVILEAKPGACVYVGLKKGISYAQLEDAIKKDENILPFMKQYKVKPGDVFKNSPGVIHSIGAGILVAEIQENSDVTYRFYDHNRKPARPLHIPQAMNSIDMDLSCNYDSKVKPVIEQNTINNSQIELLVKNPHYEVRRANIKFYDDIQVCGEGDCQIVSVIKGRVSLWFNSKMQLLQQGQTVLVAATSNPIKLATKDKESQVIIIKPGKFPKPAEKINSITLDFIDPKNVSGPVNLAMSVGGSKLTLGTVCNEGLIEMSPRIEWKKILEDKGQYNSEGFMNLLIDEIKKIVESLEIKGISRNEIYEIGIAWPGPGNYTEGILSATFIPGFSNYPFKDTLKEKLKKELGLNINIKIILDAWADAYGEMMVNPSLKNWMYINLATGIACGIVKNGSIIDKYDWPGKQSVKYGLGQIGRHIIHLEDGNWEYRPTPRGEIPDMTIGECRLTEYLGGLGLAKRFVDYVENKAKITSIIPDKFFNSSIEVLKKGLTNRDAKIIMSILSNVQKHAEEKNELAIEMISDVGRDIGKALKTLAAAFPQEFFYNRIIIGGGIGENLGKNIPAVKSNTDILLYSIIQASQIPNISRTKLNIKRELLAFRPFRFKKDTKLLIFDLDDTLYNSSKLKKMHKEILYELYRIKNNISSEEACKIVENKRKELVYCNKPSGDRNVVEALGYTFNELNALKNKYMGDQSHFVSPVNGLRERLVKLKKSYRLVLATNNLKPPTLAILKKLNIDDIFEKIYTQDETGFHKPDKRLLEMIHNDVKVPYDLMVSIGDSMSADIEPAQQLGMQVLHVKNVSDLISKIDLILLNCTKLSDNTTFKKLDQLYGFTDIDEFSLKHQKIVEDLIQINQQDLFKNWDKPKIANDKKIKFLNDLLNLENNWPDGIKGYLNNCKKLIYEYKNEINPFSKNNLFIPEKDVVTISLETKSGQINSDFIFDELKGLQKANKLAVVLVAGGIGRRLGYNGIKLAIPTELIFFMSNLERYARWIKTVEEASNKINKTNMKIPFFIMTSEGTHLKTMQLLKEKNYFDLDKEQIHIMKQNNILAVSIKSGQICRDSNDKYKLITGSAGHGDIHKLMYLHGFSNKLAKEGRYIIFIQDTNPQITNGILVSLSNSIKKNWDLNFLATSREPNEKAHIIADFYDLKNNTFQRRTINYSLIDFILKPFETNETNSQINYPGYSGAILMSAKAYDSILQQTQGKIVNVIKPKSEDDQVCIESQYEDIIMDLTKNMKSGITYFKDKRLIFSPVKNGLKLAAKLQRRKNYPDSFGSGEADFLKENRRFLKLAGVDIKVEGKPFQVEFKDDGKVNNYYFEEGAKVIISPDFAITKEIGIKKFFGDNFISDNSLFAVRGKNITFKNVYLKGGSLIIDVPDNISLFVHDICLKGSGWHYTNSSSIRGYDLIKNANSEIIDTRSKRISKIFNKWGSGRYELTQKNNQIICRLIK